MVFIAILFCLALQRFAGFGGWTQLSWFDSYLKQLNPWLIKLNEWLAILLVITPILALLVVLHFLFVWRLFGLLDLVFATFVLFFCIDARNLKIQLATYFTSLEKNNTPAAIDATTNFTGNTSPNNTEEMYRAITKAILLKSFEQLFAGLFWFMIFGIYGVVCYSLIVSISQRALNIDANYAGIVTLATRIQLILDWLPSRLVGISYALAGNFNKGFDYCRKNLWLNLAETRKFSVNAGLAALNVETNNGKITLTENHEALDLIDRVLVVWLVALALVLLGIWL